MDVIATGMATMSIFSSTSWNGMSIFLTAVAAVLIGVGIGYTARQDWSVEPEEEPEAEAV